MAARLWTFIAASMGIKGRAEVRFLLRTFKYTTSTSPKPSKCLRNVSFRFLPSFPSAPHRQYPQNSFNVTGVTYLSPTLWLFPLFETTAVASKFILPAHHLARSFKLDRRLADLLQISMQGFDSDPAHRKTRTTATQYWDCNTSSM
ncbi:hypothetical protein C8R43DRAFT_1134560 [Mycena crocata]|nr:hypothetical protein C8R43DRAFT_1134560 [Mycena crocata]